MGGDCPANGGAARNTTTARGKNWAKSMVARYTVTRTYAKTTLTLPAVIRRFVRPRTA
jgi:hypothetical protein